MHAKAIKAAAFTAFVVLGGSTIGGIAAASGSHGGGHGGQADSAGKKDAARHGDEHGHASAPHGHGMNIGELGNAANVDRTITVTMGDNNFRPAEISVGKGETIRFVVRNKGEFLHEFNIGTAAMHAEHQKEMATMADAGMITATEIVRDKSKMDHGKGGMTMAHDDPNSVLLEPGKRQEIIWHFTRRQDLEFACNVPGHYESGMMGPIHILAKGGAIN